MPAAALAIPPPEQASVVTKSKTPRTLSARDIDDLRAYAKREHLAGYGGGSHSAFSAMLERLSLMSFGSKNCTRCGGAPNKPGSGYIPKSERIPYAKQLHAYRLRMLRRHGYSATRTVKQATALRASGLDAYTWKAIEAMFPELPRLLCRECPDCKGRGTIQRSTHARAKTPLTARPNGGSRKGSVGGGPGMSDQDMIRHGRTDRRLARVRQRQPSVAFVLDDYYAQPRGREMLIGIWHRTPQGQRLLRQNRLGLDTRPFFQNLIDRQRLNPTDDLGGALARCDEQAGALLTLAIVTWNEVGP